MPVIKSAIKRMKQNEKARQRNKEARLSFRGAIKNVHKAIAVDGKEATKLVSKAYSEIDKAAKKGVIHQNTAARKKSKLAKTVLKDNKTTLTSIKEKVVGATTKKKTIKITKNKTKKTTKK